MTIYDWQRLKLHTKILTKNGDAPFIVFIAITWYGICLYKPSAASSNLPAILTIIQELWSWHIKPPKYKGGTVSYIIVEVKSPIFLSPLWQWFSYPHFSKGRLAPEVLKWTLCPRASLRPVSPSDLPRALDADGMDWLEKATEGHGFRQ